MSKKDYYQILEIQRHASEADIKKAFKKLALKYHPDRNKGDAHAEKKFKEINEAYQTLSDPEKKKRYDQFGNTDFTGFEGFGGGNGFWGQYSHGGASFDFSDIFSGMGWGDAQWYSFDFSDLFGGGSTGKKTKSQTQTEDTASLDVTETKEIPFFDFLFNNTLPIRTIYGDNLTLKIKAGTKPGTKFKIAGKWRKNGKKTGDMFVIVNAKMPSMPLDTRVEKMIEAIRYEI